MFFPDMFEVHSMLNTSLAEPSLVVASAFPSSDFFFIRRATLGAPLTAQKFGLVHSYRMAIVQNGLLDGNTVICHLRAMYFPMFGPE